MLLILTGAWNLPCQGAALAAAEQSRASAETAERAIAAAFPALVRIIVVTAKPQDGRLQKEQEAGSGAIISADGYVITNHHVAGNASRIFCDMPDGERIDAEMVGTDALADIAILKLNLNGRRKAKPLPVAKFGDSGRLRVGDTVFAMGSPAALSQSVTKGIVSNTRMVFPEFFWPSTFTLDGEEVGALVRWIGHDAPIYGGNSGGPLVNVDGEIVGINEIGLGSVAGAIPSNLARDVAAEIIHTGAVARSWTGIEAQPRLRGSAIEKGVLVGGVIEGSPAKAAGIRSGDVIARFDGMEVDCAIPDELPVFNRLVLSTPVGKRVKIDIVRDGKPLRFEVTTEARDRARGKDEELRVWGVTVRDFTRISALESGRPNRNGVQVKTLRAGGPAADAKPAMQSDDVIVSADGKTVNNVADLRRVTAEAAKGRIGATPLLVAFERDQQKLLTIVRIGPELEEDNPATARKAWIGIATQVLTKDIAEAVGLKGKSGVRVTKVFPGTNVERSGLKAGDVLLKLDGDQIAASNPEDDEVFAQSIRQHRIGDRVTLDAVRPKAEGSATDVNMRFTVELESPPLPAADLRRLKDRDFEFTARDLSFEDRSKNPSVAGEVLTGTVVEKTESGGWAQLAHVAVGDILVRVNGHAAPNVAELSKTLDQIRHDKPKRVVFYVQRGIHTLFLEVEPSWDIAEN